MNLQEGFDLLAKAPDAVTRLRELILSLAVAGKLVPQNANDEPVDALLFRVEAEKIQLSGKRNTQPDRVHAEIAFGEAAITIPDSWKWVRLQQIADARLGKMLDKGKNTGSPYPYLRNTNVQWNRFNLGDVKMIFLEPHELDEYRVRYGDLLICEGGEPGRCAIWRDQIAEVYFQKALHRVRPYGGILPDYIALCLEIDAKTGRLEKYFTGATIKHFAGRELARYCFPLPPINEQARIVTKVDELMCLCDELEARGRLEADQHARLVSTLLDSLGTSGSPHVLAENWRRVSAYFDLLLDRPEAVDAFEQTILQLAVRGFLVPQDSSDEPAEELLRKIRVEKDRLFAGGKIKRDKPVAPISDDDKPCELPTSWQWVRLADIATQITDGAHHTPEYTPQGVPFLSVKDISAGRLDFSDTRFVSEETHAELSMRCNPKPGDVLLTKIGTTGIAVVVDDDRPFSLFVSVALIKLPTALINSDYLALLINSPEVRQQSADGTEGVGNKNLVLKKIYSFLLPLPPLSEQQRIVNRASELRRLCAHLRDRLRVTQSCQTRFAEALVEQSSLADSESYESGVIEAA
ncbi:restriction endonuclease subunit S [Burkholderia sp. Bp9012]|uniref:restriction endonuclease subunit S n=1 Tax=Burkholderia sp. Bp9012 TaxID=2184562 RepID=UPI000F5A8BE1|nr:restriction endonuclease subunit S [Burkholderia sp. Bp9012]RQR72266.1 restriction endonuclease subunit S [Burkholderia sp. Bp9012]